MSNGPINFEDYPKIRSEDLRVGDQYAFRGLAGDAPWIVQTCATPWFGPDRAADLRLLYRPAPPEPPEPTKVGAVVVDSDGDVWARDAEGRWGCLDGGSASVPCFALLETWGPLRVVFEGVHQ